MIGFLSIRVGEHPPQIHRQQETPPNAGEERTVDPHGDAPPGRRYKKILCVLRVLGGYLYSFLSPGIKKGRSLRPPLCLHHVGFRAEEHCPQHQPTFITVQTPWCGVSTKKYQTFVYFASFACPTAFGGVVILIPFLSQHHCQASIRYNGCTLCNLKSHLVA